MNKTFRLKDSFGTYVANGTEADRFRVQNIEPIWEAVDQIILDFTEISSMTHSFANAFIGNLVERHPEDFRSKLRFVNCTPLVKTFIKGAMQYASQRITA